MIDFIDMESTKNQREVENRLRDALHFDRARVQTGKISRFGLLELSRQRLRPALAETSYITCPRCTGTGHIRSTESAALHILRILEEEAMKENTGALHCQVPVDVATFLLNEKRVDISRIEMRHRVNLVIVPNRHLETPAHEIVRLRHDQLNAEGVVLASYQMAEKPIEEAYQPPSAQAGDAKPVKIEAAVKGITPDQPAPIVAPRAEAPVAKAAPASSGGFFARIMSFFSGSTPQAAPVAPAEQAERPPRRDGDRNRNGNREGGRGGRDRNRSRDGRDNREGGERKERGEQPPRSQGRRDEAQGEGGNRKPRDPKEQREPREPREAREPRPPREPKEQREPREPREPRAPRNDADGSQNGQSSAPASGNDNGQGQDGEARSGRRSRGRGRGRGRNEEGGATEVAAAGFVADQAAGFTPVASEAVEPRQQAPAPAFEPVPAAPVAETPVVQVAPAEETPTPIVAEPVAQMAVVVAEPVPLPVAVPTPAPVVEPAPQVIAAPEAR